MKRALYTREGSAKSSAYNHMKTTSCLPTSCCPSTSNLTGTCVNSSTQSAVLNITCVECLKNGNYSWTNSCLPSNWPYPCKGVTKATDSCIYQIGAYYYNCNTFPPTVDGYTCKSSCSITQSDPEACIANGGTLTTTCVGS
jgi:hypothetical protein